MKQKKRTRKNVATTDSQVWDSRLLGKVIQTSLEMSHVNGFKTHLDFSKIPQFVQETLLRKEEEDTKTLSLNPCCIILGVRDENNMIEIKRRKQVDDAFPFVKRQVSKSMAESKNVAGKDASKAAAAAVPLWSKVRMLAQDFKEEFCKTQACDRMMIVFSEKSMCLKQIYNIFEFAKKNIQIQNFVFVVPNQLSKRIQQTLAKLPPTIRLRVFRFHELIINFTKNKYHPIHLRLTEEESGQILSHFFLNKGQLPVLMQPQPEVRHYDFKLGDVIFIVNNQSPSGPSKGFRLVV